ncbi:hypothetical protein HPMBJEAJ_00317 [Aeromonas phage avDM6]|nr:hypothetical protein HPMBJEAJ_00317 [Aeromonas phage avDM6]
MKYKDSMAVLQEISNRNKANIAKIFDNIYCEITENMVNTREITKTFTTGYVDDWVQQFVPKSINFDVSMVYNEIVRQFPNLGYNIEFDRKNNTFEVSIRQKVLIEFAKNESQCSYDCVLDGI